MRSNNPFLDPVRTTPGSTYYAFSPPDNYGEGPSDGPSAGPNSASPSNSYNFELCDLKADPPAYQSTSDLPSTMEVTSSRSQAPEIIMPEPVATPTTWTRLLGHEQYGTPPNTAITGVEANRPPTSQNGACCSLLCILLIICACAAIVGGLGYFAQKIPTWYP